MTRIGIIDAELGDDVEPVGADERVEAAGRRTSRTWSSSAAIRRGVNTRDIRPAVHRVQRRVLEQDHAGRQLDARP